jgi:hypothetical protein
MAKHWCTLTPAHQRGGREIEGKAARPSSSEHPDWHTVHYPARGPVPRRHPSSSQPELPACLVVLTHGMVRPCGSKIRSGAICEMTLPPQSIMKRWILGSDELSRAPLRHKRTELKLALGLIAGVRSDGCGRSAAPMSSLQAILPPIAKPRGAKLAAPSQNLYLSPARAAKLALRVSSR